MIIEMNLFKVAQGGESVREFREGNGSPRRQNRTVRTFKFLLENTFAVTFRRVFVCFINRFENDLKTSRTRPENDVRTILKRFGTDMKTT